MLQNRRTFLKMGAGLCMATALSNVSVAQNTTTLSALSAQPGPLPLNITQLRLSIGAQKPFQALHVSDSHLCLADERENERKRTLAVARNRYFSKAQLYLDAAIAHAKQNNELFLHTGDLIDFVSESNLDAVQARLSSAFCFVSSGNHEFSQYVGEAKEDDAYKAQSFNRVQQSFPNDLTFCSRVIHGINFVALDDVYYNFTAKQMELFKAEVAKELPIVMLCHCPLYTPELFDHVLHKEKAGCAYVVGAPDERMDSYRQGR